MRSFLVEAAQTIGVVALMAAGFTWFGVYDMTAPAWLRFMMWFVTIGVGAIASIWTVPFVFHGRLKALHPALQIATASILLSVPVTLSLEFLDVFFGGRFDSGELPVQFIYVLAVSIVIVIVMYLIERVRRSDEDTGAAPEDRIAGFLERLPVKYRGAALWAISSEDHYLRIHTDRGEELILMRLADAMRELDGAGGLQIHRSWWVAKDGVADAKRENGKLVLVLKSGKEAPVSRTFQPDVRKAGLA